MTVMLFALLGLLGVAFGAEVKALVAAKPALVACGTAMCPASEGCGNPSCSCCGMCTQQVCEPPKKCTCGEKCTMSSGGSGVCQPSGICAVNIMAPNCEPKKCTCGEPCTMSGGGSGVCQPGGFCAVNIMAPNCGGCTKCGASCNAVKSGICNKNLKCVTKTDAVMKTCPKPAKCKCGESCKMASGASGVCQESGICAVNIQAPNCGKKCKCGEKCKMAGGGTGVCQTDGKTCAVNVKAPDCAKKCPCGEKCKMAGGGSGVCQTDEKTCAVNVKPPDCSNKCPPHVCPMIMPICNPPSKIETPMVNGCPGCPTCVAPSCKADSDCTDGFCYAEKCYAYVGLGASCGGFTLPPGSRCRPGLECKMNSTIPDLPGKCVLSCPPCPVLTCPLRLQIAPVASANMDATACPLCKRCCTGKNCPAASG